MEDLTTFLLSIGQEVEDAEEESFLLFSQSIPSSNLGFVNSKATTIDITIHNQDYTIHQSPTLLSSSRAGGTTGAVLWKITPLFSSWISSTTSNPLWTNSFLTSTSTAVELGCGISGLTALTLSPHIRHYVATDQEYVQRLFRQNLESNPPQPSRSPASRPKGNSKGQKHKPKPSNPHNNGGERIHKTITFTPLDWELHTPDLLKQGLGDNTDEEDKGFDLLLSCDCIYNEALIEPFVRTCADISRLRHSPFSSPSGNIVVDKKGGGKNPTICIIAQQQRSPEVFEAWLMETMKYFRVWRVRDEVIGSSGLGEGSGYLVHVLLLKD